MVRQRILQQRMERRGKLQQRMGRRGILQRRELKNFYTELKHKCLISQLDLGTPEIENTTAEILLLRQIHNFKYTPSFRLHFLLFLYQSQIIAL
jgi:hypothetical protein